MLRQLTLLKDEKVLEQIINEVYCVQVATLFGVSPEDISILEFNHATDNLLKTFQFQSGFLVLIDRLGMVLMFDEKVIIDSGFKV